MQKIETLHGPLWIDRAQDHKMASVLERGEYPNEDLLQLASAFVTKDSVVVDIGAHIGTFSVPIAERVKEVVAVEPSAHTHAILSQTVAERGASVRIVNKGLGAVAGSGSLVARSDTNAGANTLVPGGDIVVSTLDAELTKADFIKIDVEGMELQVLEGGRRVMAERRPVVFFEVNLSQLRAHGASPKKLQAFFVARGYRLYIPLPIFGTRLARVRSATLLTMFMAPRAWFTHCDSAPFDLLAVPQEYFLPLPKAGFWIALAYAFAQNMQAKFRRVRAFLRHA